jgi:2Fe-2S ferredoxin
VTAAPQSRAIVRVEPSGVDLEPARGETMIEAAWRLGYYWPTVCYGQAQCTVCHVEVVEGDEHLTPIEDDERDALEHRLPGAHRRDTTRVRLACQARVTGPVTVLKHGVRPIESTSPGPVL